MILRSRELELELWQAGGGRGKVWGIGRVLPCKRYFILGGRGGSIATRVAHRSLDQPKMQRPLHSSAGITVAE